MFAKLGSLQMNFKLYWRKESFIKALRKVLQMFASSLQRIQKTLQSWQKIIFDRKHPGEKVRNKLKILKEINLKYSSNNQVFLGPVYI